MTSPFPRDFEVRSPFSSELKSFLRLLQLTPHLRIVSLAVACLSPALDLNVDKKDDGLELDDGS